MATTISSVHLNRLPYNWLIYDLLDIQLERHKTWLKGTVYDLGCGDQPYRDWLLQVADQYVGVDWGSSLHDHKADIVADLNQPLPIETGVADTVFSISVIEHLSEPQLMLNEAFRILKQGGTIVLQVPFMWWVHEAPHDYYRFTNYGLLHLFSKAGFSEISVDPMSGFWSMWVLKFNYQSKRLIRGPAPIRKLLEIALHITWQINQRIARWLDRRWKCPEEAAGYFVVAKKL